MSTSVTITGTGCPIPDGNRAGPGALVRHDDLTLQFDVGRSTVQRLAGANVWIPSLSAVFITHHHSDHLTGLTDLVLTRWTMDRTEDSPPLPIIAVEGPASRYIKTLLDGWDEDIDVRAGHAMRKTRPAVDLTTFDLPSTPTEIWRRGDVVVSAAEVRHEPVEAAVGYRVDTPDGSVVITGDTRVCEEVAELARGADVIVYEAMQYSFFDKMPERRRYVRDYHADTVEIGQQMAALGIPKVILTHLIPAPTTEAERQSFVDEVRQGGYEGELVVADDLYCCAVGTGGLPDVKEIIHTAEQD